eukprot:6482942-Amphidinium_carterae.1
MLSWVNRGNSVIDRTSRETLQVPTHDQKHVINKIRLRVHQLANSLGAERKCKERQEQYPKLKVRKCLVLVVEVGVVFGHESCFAELSDP